MRTLLAVSLILALSASGAAHHCTTWDSSSPEVDAGGIYVDVDCWPHDCQVDAMPQVWLYSESNGIPGLQRGDELVNDTCHGMIPADAVIF